MADLDYYGLEMLWKLEKNNVVTKSDVLMVFVHWYLTKHNYRNIGVGDDKTLNDNIERSELLPEGWNGNNASYALRYAIGDELYILHGTVSNGTMIINLLQVKTLKVSNAAFDLESTVRSIHGDTINTLITDVDKQILRLNNELEHPIGDGASQTTGTQTVANKSESGSVASTLEYIRNNRHMLVERPPVQVGQADLSPLGRLGGGMLMDPLRPSLGMPRYPGGLPILPGARFDPMGPNLNRINRPGPDHDHLPPPGYDDMFM